MTTSLKKIREFQGLTQQQVAERVGITKGYYSLIENGKRGKNGPSYDLATKIAEVFDMKPDDIFLEK
jgi:putative transcriptional regulator